MNNIVMVISNEDAYVAPFTLCPKEVLQRSYINAIGKKIDFYGEPRKVISVKITEGSIHIELEPSFEIPKALSSIGIDLDGDIVRDQYGNRIYLKLI